MNNTQDPQPGDYVSGQYQYNGRLRRTEGVVIRVIQTSRSGALVAITVKDTKVKRYLEGETVQLIHRPAS